MDAIGLLLAAAALALFPAGLYLASVAALGAWAGRLPAGARGSWTVAEAIGGAVVVAAVSLAPLPGSPAQTLPPGAGAANNVVAALLLMAVAVAVAGSPRWPAPRVLAGAACLTAVFGLAAGQSTLAFATVVAVPGNSIFLARLLAGVSVLVAAPLLAPPRDPGVSRPARALLSTALSILGLSLFVPASLSGQAAWVVALVVAAAAAAHAAAQHWLRLQAHGRSNALAGLSAAAAAAAAVLAVLSAS